MADYIRDIGPGDQMMIRDTGYNVEYWFHSDQYTWNNQQRWGQQSNGGYSEGTFALAKGGAWHHLGTVGVGSTQDVLFRMFDSGLGWGTYDFWQRIDRATVPGVPYWVDGPRAVGVNNAYMQFYGNGDGGTPVREWQIGYGTDPNYPQYYVGSNGVSNIGGLAGGTWWYFWVRGRNDVGWSGWSGRGQAFTWRVPDSPSAVEFSLITQKSIRTRFTGGFAGGFEAGAAVREWQLAYGKDPNTAQVYVASNGTNDLTNLDPGRTYYFWARGRNDVGWGPWSPVRVATLRAGAYVKVNGVWRRALPYEKVNGVWRLERPFVKTVGTWRETA